jgi:hypothetical protein
MRVQVNEIGKILNESKERLVIIGQPKGVGLTTSLIEFFTEKLFFEENFSVFLLVDNIRTKSEIANMLEEFLYSAYEYNTKFNYSNNVIKVYNNILAIISYTDSDLAIIEDVNSNFKFQYGVIEKDDDNEMLNYYLTEYLPNICNRIIVATYDKEDSIFYMVEDENVLKLIVFSELSKKNIQMLNRMSDYTLDFEKITKGYFNHD